MNELLCEFYDNFYISLVLSRHCLIDGLDNPDRKDKIAKELAFDSFVCGFKLALQLSTGLNQYRELPLDRSRTLDDSVAVAMFREGRKE